MEYEIIGNGKIKLSKIGFGTGSSGYTGINLQTRLTERQLADVLMYAYDKGINFWDTGYSYGTHPHLREALKQIPRDKVIIATKFSDTFEKSTHKKIIETLKALKTDYLDICLLHGVRNAFEMKMRSGAHKALVKAKEKGYVRSIGISAHGIGAIEASLDIPEIEVVFARINWSGVSMDAYQEGFLSKLVAVPYVKEVARKIIPKKVIPSLSAQVESLQSNEQEQETVKNLLQKCHSLNKSVIGMKIFGAGALTHEIEKSLKFIMSLKYVKAFVLGMTSKEEVDENVRIYERLLSSTDYADLHRLKDKEFIKTINV
ncbi:aldo/keto reductase [Candidatus Kuenenia sp.]|uniref:aldo/keto reductase n=1 Tax=Candidatus Kuenenia sp. TaxID=2499824 RepID=UPI003220852A